MIVTRVTRRGTRGRALEQLLPCAALPAGTGPSPRRSSCRVCKQPSFPAFLAYLRILPGCQPPPSVIFDFLHPETLCLLSNGSLAYLWNSQLVLSITLWLPCSFPLCVVRFRLKTAVSCRRTLLCLCRVCLGSFSVGAEAGADLGTLRLPHHSWVVCLACGPAGAGSCAGPVQVRVSTETSVTAGTRVY